MSQSTIIDARLMIQEATNRTENLFWSMKNQVEKSLNLNSSWHLVKKIKADLFPRPNKEIKLFTKAEISDVSSVSTFDSDAGLREKFEELKLSKRDYLSRNERKKVKKNSGKGDKKIKVVLNKLHRFEDICVEKRFLKKKEELLKIREKSKKILGKILDKFESFRFQHADSISLSILYLTAVEVGLTKKKFLDAAKLITSKKVISIDIIKKSKCYGMVKILLRS